MTVWLNPDDVAERLGVCRRTAMALMYQMNYSVIGGTARKRIRVSEDSLNVWMMKHSQGTVEPRSGSKGNTKKLARR